MIVGVGTDICVVERFEAMLARRPGLVERLLTASEQALSINSQAARFAAKEALAKALASPGGLRWLDVEVVKNTDGAPRFEISGTVAERVALLGVERIHLSLSHDGGFATAMVVCES
ncbi:MAG: holo-ACP synthase [Arachnia sp.]